MKRTAVVECLVFTVLVVAGASVRVSLSHLPNFAPVAAIALFAGFWFRSWIVAACVPLAIMGVSDYVLGGYDFGLMLIVHGSLALPVCGRSLLRARLGQLGAGKTKTAGASGPMGESRPNCESRLIQFFVGASVASLAASTSFFLLSNLGSWLTSDLYETTVAGLVRCYWNAIPFFRATLLGDFIFTWALFGGYAVAVQNGLVASAIGETKNDAPGRCATSNDPSLYGP